MPCWCIVMQKIKYKELPIMGKHVFTRNRFSLIELLIVIAIIGALSALIIPAFSTSERDAKSVSDNYNSKGILRYLHMFQNANGCYPSGFHTGLDGTGAALESLPPSILHEGTLEAAFSVVELGDADGAKYISSLKGAGINYLCSGDVSTATAAPLKDNTTTVKVIKVDPTQLDIVFNGRELASYLKPIQFEMSGHADNGIIAAFFVTPNVDWETVYDGAYHGHGDHGHFENRTASKIALKNTPASSVSDAEFKYFIALFKLNNNGSDAQLIGMVSPDLTAAE